MTDLASRVISLLQGKTLATAESCTGGGIGSALTAVSGSSAVFKGGIISYTNEIKENLLGVPDSLLKSRGAVSVPVAEAMAQGARKALMSDIAVSVTGLAGPGGDEFGNPVGTVFIGYADEKSCVVREFHLTGERDEVRRQASASALSLILEQNR